MDCLERTLDPLIPLTLILVTLPLIWQWSINGTNNPISKESHFEIEKIQKWLNYGVKPTEVVSSLLKKAEIIKN